MWRLCVLSKPAAHSDEVFTYATGDPKRGTATKNISQVIYGL
jgi:hypothetical protein